MTANIMHVVSPRFIRRMLLEYRIFKRNKNIRQLELLVRFKKYNVDLQCNTNK